MTIMSAACAKAEAVKPAALPALPVQGGLQAGRIIGWQQYVAGAPME